MRFRIFLLAFSVGFVFCFSAAIFFVFRFSGNNTAEAKPESPENVIYLETEKAVFLLAFENEKGFGPFTLINFDAKTGRIPVFYHPVQ